MTHIGDVFTSLYASPLTGLSQRAPLSNPFTTCPSSPGGQPSILHSRSSFLHRRTPPTQVSNTTHLGRLIPSCRPKATLTLPQQSLARHWLTITHRRNWGMRVRKSRSRRRYGIKIMTGKRRGWTMISPRRTRLTSTSVRTPLSVSKWWLDCWSRSDTGSKISATDKNPPPNAAAFKPIILHSAHDPVPMSMVCRAPRGSAFPFLPRLIIMLIYLVPGHGDTYNPQDQAWLAGFKFAKKNVFV